MTPERSVAVHTRGGRRGRGAPGGKREDKKDFAAKFARYTPEKFFKTVLFLFWEMSHPWTCGLVYAVSSIAVVGGGGCSGAALPWRCGCGTSGGEGDEGDVGIKVSPITKVSPQHFARPRQHGRRGPHRRPTRHGASAAPRPRGPLQAGLAEGLAAPASRV